MSSTQLIEQCATRLRGIVEALDNIHDNTPHRWSTDLDEVHSSAESLLAMIKDQAPARSETSFEEWLANELEGEDGQPVPAAVCDIALARRAFNHWPKLEQPAKVGGVRFSAGVSSRLVVEAAQRLYEFESTPEKEAERIERLQAFREQLDPLNLAPHAEAFNEAPAEALKSEQAEAERPEVVAWQYRVTAGPQTGWSLWHPGKGEEFERSYTVERRPLMTVAQYERITAKLHDALDESDGDRWKMRSERDAANARLHEVATACATAEQERDAALAEVERLRQFERICEGLPQDAIDGGWTVQGIRGYAKRLEDQLKSALARVAELEKQEPVGWANFRDGRFGAYLHRTEDDARRFDSTALAGKPAGSKQLALYAAPVAQAQQLHDMDKQCRDDVARALGLRPNEERGFAWSYLLSSIKACVKASENTAQAGQVPAAWYYDAPSQAEAAIIDIRGMWGEDDCPTYEDVAAALRRLLAAAPGKEVPQAWLDVQAERSRQVEAECWTPEHDDAHSHGQMARAAACYALAGSSAPNDGTAALLVSLAWPWDEQWWKPSTARRDLIKAGALILAEIERIDRVAASQGGPSDA
ncbi:TPA: hypothetical protein ACPWFP_004665 [Pseudomonas aeruginosa]